MEKIEKRILSYLAKKDRLNFWEMVPYLSQPFVETVKMLKGLENEKLIEIKGGCIILTKKGREKIKTLGIVGSDLPNVITSIKIDQESLKKFTKLRKKRFFKEEYDQLPILPVGIMRKISVMKSKGDLEGKKIICLGDDDMAGIALALTGSPLEISVLDIDKDIVDYENEVFKALKVKAKAYQADLLKPIPQALKHKYDVFVTEPPDTVFGNSLFFSRGIECIKKEGGVGYLGISAVDFSKKRYLAVEKNILRSGCLITDLFSRLEPYEIGNEDKWIFNLPFNFGWPKKPWFFSDLLRIEVLEGAKPLFPGVIRKELVKELIQTNIYC